MYDAAFFSSDNLVHVWFNTVGLKKYRQEPGMRALYDLQQEMDTTARHLFDLYKAGKIDLTQ